MADSCNPIVLTSRLGSSAVFSSPLHSHVGEDAHCEVPVVSRLGRGPAGADGTQIVLVPDASWPPLNPTEGVLYLRGE